MASASSMVPERMVIGRDSSGGMLVALPQLACMDRLLYYVLGNRGYPYNEQTIRSGAGYAGHPPAQDSRIGTAARLGHQPAPETSLREHSASERRFTLSRASQTGT